MKVQTRAVERKSIPVRRTRAIHKLMCSSCMGKCNMVKTKTIYLDCNEKMRNSTKAEYTTNQPSNQKFGPIPTQLINNLPQMEAPEVCVKC